MNENFELSDIRIKYYDNNNTELKWCLFVNNKRASIGKIICELNNNKYNNIKKNKKDLNNLIILDNEKSVYVKTLFVNKNYRGKNLSKLLLTKCKNSLIENG